MPPHNFPGISPGILRLGFPPLVLADNERPPTSSREYRKEELGVKTTIVLAPNASSPIMAMCRVFETGADEPNEDDVEVLRPVYPWLVGLVEYRTVYNSAHRTQFCVRGLTGGRIQEYYGPPYNERT